MGYLILPIDFKSIIFQDGFSSAPEDQLFIQLSGHQIDHPSEGFGDLIMEMISGFYHL